MKKSIYKIISMIISISILLSFSSFSAFAQNSTTPYSLIEGQKIASALNSMEVVKNRTELYDVDFSEIKVSNKLKLITTRMMDLFSILISLHSNSITN